MWEQLLISLSRFILLLHPSSLIFDVRVWSFACRNRDSDIGGNTLSCFGALLSFYFIIEAILTSQSLLLVPVVSQAEARVVASLVSPVLNSLPPRLPSPGALLAA